MEHTLSQNDIDLLRRLGSEVANIAALPVQSDTANLWRLLNDLENCRPLIAVYQIPWHEMNIDNELTLKADNEWAREAETVLRRTLYQWSHIRWDMVVEPVFYVPLAIRSTGYGIRTRMEEIFPDARKGGVSSKHYDPQILTEKDIEKIKIPEITIDHKATGFLYERACMVFDGILQVEVQGCIAHYYAPWDRLAEWCGPQQVLIDLMLRPDFVHEAIKRLTEACLQEVIQLEEKGGLSPYAPNHVIGQGGLGYTSHLPAACKGRPLLLKHQWGSCMAQIFSSVSPAMHEEFALAYERRLMELFGLAYYGCCEPLDRKVETVARNIPNLRKISMSPWVNPKLGAEAIAGRFVYSGKPNPAFLATDRNWDRNSAESEISAILEANNGKHVELVLKDVSTLRHEPKRLWEWMEMARAAVRKYE